MPAELTYKQAQAKVMALIRQVTRAADTIRSEAAAMHEDARDTTQVAETISSLGVDQDTIAETQALAQRMYGLSEATRSYASATENTVRAAQAAYDQNRASHGGIAEAVNRSEVNVRGLNREWLRQE